MATIKDVAAEAGVSVSTASRSLNNNPRISAATRQRVKAAAAKLDYHPNYNARSLTMGESNIVGLIFPVTAENAPADPFHLDLMRGVAAALAPYQYETAVAIGRTMTELLGHVQSLVRQSNVRRFIVFYSRKDDLVTAFLRSQQLNFIVVGQPDTQFNDRFVNNDNRAAGTAAVQYLLSHRPVQHPLYVYSSHNWLYEQARGQGIVEGLPAGSLLTCQLGTLEQVQGQLEKQSFDAVIASDDVILLRFLSVTHSWQPNIQQLPTLCFNNSRLLNMAMPEVIKVDLQPRQLGRAAVKLLFNSPIEHDHLVSFKICP